MTDQNMLHHRLVRILNLHPDSTDAQLVEAVRQLSIDCAIQASYITNPPALKRCFEYERVLRFIVDKGKTTRPTVEDEANFGMLAWKVAKEVLEPAGETHNAD